MQERKDFENYNKETKILQTFRDVCVKEFAELNLDFVIGGKISFDLFPKVYNT